MHRRSDWRPAAEVRRPAAGGRHHRGRRDRAGHRLDNGLDALGDQQVAEQVTVAFRHGDRMEVPLAVARPERTLPHEPVAYGTDSPPTFVRLRDASVGWPHYREQVLFVSLHCDLWEAGRAPLPIVVTAA